MFKNSCCVYSITNGKKAFSWSIPDGDMIQATELAAGLDENGKPIIIVVATLDITPPQQTFCIHYNDYTTNL